MSMDIPNCQLQHELTAVYHVFTTQLLKLTRVYIFGNIGLPFVLNVKENNSQK